MSAAQTVMMCVTTVTCRPPRYAATPAVMAAAAAQHADDPETLRAVRVCELLSDCDELLDVVSCVSRPLMCDVCVAYLFVILLDLPWVLDDLDFAVDTDDGRGARQARAYLHASLRRFCGPIPDLAGQDVRTITEAVGDALPWLAEQQGAGLHGLALQVSDAAAQARHIVFREHEERGYLPDPDYPAAGQW